MTKNKAALRIGIGGWKYEPWRGRFYPPGLPQRLELSYASERLSAIEINSTYYGTQKASSFAKWREETPDGFKFSLKAPRVATQRRRLAEAGESVQRFVNSGIAELGDKLGPIVWQFPPSKALDLDDLRAFLELLPDSVDGLPLRHVLDWRHPGFLGEEGLALARSFSVATVFTDSPDYPSYADRTSGDLVYARLMQSRPKVATGYPEKELKTWAAVLQDWQTGRVPENLPYFGGRPPPSGKDCQQVPQEVYLFFINGAKENAPAAAQALLASRV